MTNQTEVPYGAWPSPISAESLVAGARGISGLQYDGEYLYWLESRPEQGGRQTIMRWREGGELEELLSEPFNARSRVHEYGGGSFVVHGATIWFSNFGDQRVYRFTIGDSPEPITPAADVRYAAFTVDAARSRLICVREDHRYSGEAHNELVAVAMNGDGSHGTSLFSQSDFVSAAHLSPDGEQLAFVSWDHPNMPWDNTNLWSASFDQAGLLDKLVMHNNSVDSDGESIIDPQWAPDGSLYAISDRDNWWSIYRIEGTDFKKVAGLTGSEIGGPMWSLGSNHYQFAGNNTILAEVNRLSVGTLAFINTESGNIKPLAIPTTAISSIATGEGKLAVVCQFSDRPAQLVSINAVGDIEHVVRSANDKLLDVAWVPDYQLLSFPTAGGKSVAYGIYLPPSNPNVCSPEGVAPPLIVTVHGGPTGVATPSLKMSHLYWTSRGFAILDLNYRGSTGFGREYRRELYGEWGVADIEDAVSGANYLAERGLADSERLIIRGGSAGGYTALAAHAFHNTFATGASCYGISDLEVLAKDTHKFEARYLDQVIGPYPERRDLYRERSPINNLDGFKAPLILLQGLDDQVVPPNQSEMIYQALKQRGIATAYIEFEGEGHGFRKAENIIRAQQAELYFYAKVLGFTPDDDLPEIEIDNMG